jgi:hypothetical protein
VKPWAFEPFAHRLKRGLAYEPRPSKRLRPGKQARATSEASAEPESGQVCSNQGRRIFAQALESEAPLTTQQVSKYPTRKEVEALSKRNKALSAVSIGGLTHRLSVTHKYVAPRVSTKQLSNAKCMRDSTLFLCLSHLRVRHYRH